MKTFCAMVCGAALLLPSAGAASTAVLAEPVKFPVMMNGRQIGESKVQAGAIVEVLEQSDGRVRIKYGAAEPQWVADSAVRDVRLAEPEETPAPEVAAGPAEDEPAAEEQEEAPPSGVEDDPPSSPEAAAAEEPEPAAPATAEAEAGGDPVRFEITLKGAKVPVERWGTGETGIIFFSNSGDMAADIRKAMENYQGLRENGCSLFLWKYPQAEPFKGVQNAIGAFKAGGEERVDFTGVATAVLDEIKKQSGLQKFLLVGNSLGGGVILWDHAALAKDENLKFLLISPTEVFMPEVEKVGPMDRTALIAHRRGDDFVKDRKINAWIAANRSALTGEVDSRAGHIIVGSDLGHGQLVGMIASFLELPKGRGR
jgi:alpha/beta superfamily hydrolase